jgi:hypothetical protein
MQRTPPTSINRLLRADARKLEDYVHEHYTASGLSDSAFAVQAANVLGLTLTQHSVAGAREVFGIQSNREAFRAAARAADSLPARVTTLEHEVAGLRAAFDVFKHGCRGDRG